MKVHLSGHIDSYDAETDSFWSRLFFSNGDKTEYEGEFKITAIHKSQITKITKPEQLVGRIIAWEKDRKIRLCRCFYTRRHLKEARQRAKELSAAIAKLAI